jgi:hypothetical protein
LDGEFRIAGINDVHVQDDLVTANVPCVDFKTTLKEFVIIRRDYNGAELTTRNGMSPMSTEMNLNDLKGEGIWART